MTIECIHCQGNLEVWTQQGTGGAWVPCGLCKGTGRITPDLIDDYNIWLTDPESWWKKKLEDPEFRKACGLEVTPPPAWGNEIPQGSGASGGTAGGGSRAEAAEAVG